MRGARLGSVGLTRLRRELSDRDLAVIGHVGELRLMTTGQVESLCFPVEDFATALTARRVARRVLERLARDRLLIRLERRIGGVSSGSTGWIYALGPVGARILTAEGHRRRHYREPSATFASHTLAISLLAVDLMAKARSGVFEVADLEAEPRCWRRFGGLGGQSLLRPDLFVSLNVGQDEYRWFIEVDLGTEHVPTLVRKCQVYVRYYQTGIEQGRHEVFPRVCWVVPNEQRAKKLSQALQYSGNVVEGLFVVTTTEEALAALAGGRA